MTTTSSLLVTASASASQSHRGPQCSHSGWADRRIQNRPFLPDLMFMALTVS